MQALRVCRLLKHFRCSHAGDTDKAQILCCHALRLLSIQPTLAECGNLMRAMLYMYYGGHQETAFNEEDKPRARKLRAFINAAKA